MSKPYDAATKRLIELRPADWVALLNLPAGPVSLVDADLSTVSAAADRLIRVDAPIPYLVHNELESGKDTAAVPFRTLRYNVGAEYKLGLPVVSNVFLLHKASHSPALTGVLSRTGPEGAVYLTFHYNVIRVWELDVERLLSGGIGTLPLAPIANVTQNELPEVISRMEARIEAEVPGDTEAGDLWTATYILMGLRYNKALNAQLLQGVRRMKESVTYQAILEEGEEQGLIKGRIEGELQEARRILLRQGVRRLGLITLGNEARVQTIFSLTVLEALLDRVSDVETWDDLLHDLPGA